MLFSFLVFQFYFTGRRRVLHYSDVKLDAIESHITSLTIVYTTVYSDSDKKKTLKLCVTGLCVGNSPVTGEFPAQMASNAENVSIWWRHHVLIVMGMLICLRNWQNRFLKKVLY